MNIRKQNILAAVQLGVIEPDKAWELWQEAESEPYDLSWEERLGLKEESNVVPTRNDCRATINLSDRLSLAYVPRVYRVRKDS